MQDEATGSWWQQITGEAIFGSSKGQRLKPVPHDELSFALWKLEHPYGRVLRPDDSKPWKKFSENCQASGPPGIESGYAVERSNSDHRDQDGSYGQGVPAVSRSAAESYIGSHRGYTGDHSGG